MSVELKTPIYQPSVGRDVNTVFATLDFNPDQHDTPEKAAKAFYEVLNKFAIAAGYCETSVSLWNPQEASERGYVRNWMVSWKDGPFEWGIYASGVVASRIHGWFTEPYYSFDLCFTE